MIDDQGKALLKTVLILDDDLGFVFWLGHVLDAAAYSALPAKSVVDAAKLVMQLDLTVDVLVVNLALPGIFDFIADLHHSPENWRIIGVLNHPVEAANIPGVNAVQLKPSNLDEIAKVEWLQCIDSVLANTRHAGMSAS